MEKQPRRDSMLCERLVSNTTVEVLIDSADPSGRMLYFGLTLRGEVSPKDHCRISVSPALHSSMVPNQIFQLLLESLDLEVKGGGACGLPLTWCCLTITGVDYCEERSTEKAVRLAASRAIQQFLKQAIVEGR